MVDNEICENSNCESIRVIDDDQKSLSGVEGRLYDAEINKGVINTEVSVAKNYHNCEPHDSVNANYSTNKLQKVSEDECCKNTVGSNVSFSSKYQMRKSKISNKSLNESPPKVISCVHISLEGVGVKNQTDVITPTSVLANK